MKKSPLVESIYNKLVNERVTDIVYHGTGLIELRQILEQDRVMTSVATGVRADTKFNKGKFFFFSTARSINTFREGFGLPQKAAVIVLDGRKLSQKYKAAAVDYWGPDFLDQDETEDRIVTDEPYIDDFSKYIKEVRILFPVKSFRSVSHAENDSIEKSVDILKAKGIPVKILTDKKYFYINNPKNYMTTKEEWAEFLEKNGYSIGEKRPEDDVGTNLRKATPYNDAAHLAELIKMVEKGNLDFSSFPSKDKVTQIKNDLYKHLVDPEGDGKEPKYADDEDEKIKNMMLKGQQVISAQQVQDMYGQIVYYLRDFAPSVGISIQNNRKNPDARENLTVISKYMRKNKLRDLETLGAFLKTRIDAIRDGKMKKVAEDIMGKMLEKNKYDVKNPVLWSASYSEMIYFENSGDFFIPLGEDFLKRALDVEPTKGTVFHVTDYRGVYGLLNMQGKKKAIAGFTQLGDTVADKMFTRGVGAGRSSGFVVELEGDVLTSFFRDARTRPEKGGRRNVKLVTLQKSIGRQGFMKVRKEILQKLHQYNEKMGAKSKIPPQEKIPQGQDASVVLDAWRKQVMKATKPGPRMTKRYKEQGKPVPKGDGKKLAHMVKYYLDTVEEIVKNNQEMFKKAIIDADMGEKGGYTGYDEKNIEKFRVKNVFLVKGSPAEEEVGDTNLPADLEKEGVGYMPGMTQDMMLQYINSAPKNEGWSEKYKKSIDCDNPKGFSQRAHCDGRKKKVEDIQQRIYNKIAEKSAKKYRGVMNRESYGDMIQFDSVLEMFIPLGSTILKRAVGDLPENVKGFHISNLEGIANLFNIEGSTKAISTFTRGAKPKFIRDGITGRGGVVAELEGRLITSSLKDVFSLPEKGGRRNILLGNLQGLIGDDGKSKEIVDDLVSGIKKWVDNNTEGDNTIALNTWNEKVRSADGKQKQEMVKYYLDLAESVMKKHSKTIEYALLNPFKSSVSNYDAMDIYDENVMDRFKVKGVYFVDKYYKKRGMAGFPTDEEFKEFISDMSKKGIEVMSGTAKEIADMVNSSLGKDGATKYFEGSESIQEEIKFKVRGYIKPLDSFKTLEEWKEFANKVLELQKQGQSVRGGTIEGKELEELVNDYYKFQRNVEVERYELLTDRNILDHVEDFANHRVWSFEREFGSYFPDMSKLKFAFFYSRGDLEPYVLLDENYTEALYGSIDNEKELQHYTTPEGLENIEAAIESGDTFDISSYTVAKRPFFRSESNIIITFLGNVRAAFKSDVKSFAVEGGRRAANMYRLNYPGDDKTNICMDLDTDCANGSETTLWNEIIATPIKILEKKELDSLSERIYNKLLKGL